MELLRGSEEQIQWITARGSTKPELALVFIQGSVSVEDNDTSKDNISSKSWVQSGLFEWQPPRTAKQSVVWKDNIEGEPLAV